MARGGEVRRTWLRASVGVLLVGLTLTGVSARSVGGLARVHDGALALAGPVAVGVVVALGASLTMLAFAVTGGWARESLQRARLERLGAEIRRRDSDLRRRGAEAEAASAAKSELLRRTSHDIRSPLTNILGTIDLLLAGELGDEARRRLRTVHASAEHLLRLASELLDLARAESGSLPPGEEDVNLGALLDDVAESFQARARAKGIDLRVCWESAIPSAVGADPTRLREILNNLLDNAVRHTERGRVTVIASVDRGGTLTLRVVDTGSGMARERLAGLFDAGCGRARDDASGGTGLGLAITRGLVTALGGAIEARSEAGEGSAFTVTLPVNLEGCSAADVLVVDDAPEVRAFMRDRLGREGLAVLGVGSCADAEAELSRAGPDAFPLILIDGRLPDCPGEHCLARLRRLAPGARFVALTGDVGSEGRMLGAGFHAFLPKPFSDAQLAAAVGRGRESAAA